MNNNLDLNMLKTLVNDVPFYDKEKKKQEFTSDIRKEILNCYNHQCVLCKQYRSVNVNIETHHIHPQGEPILDNGVALCEECHYIVHFFLHNLRGYKKIPQDWEKRQINIEQELSLFVQFFSLEFKKIRFQIDKLKEGRQPRDWREFDYMDMYKDTENE
jgi:predicted restriction endonuclease